MGQVRETRCGYVYVSDNGIVYEIGENGADFNILIDNFTDYDEECDDPGLVSAHLVDFVYGDIDDEDTLEWIDNRIERYENHERTIRMYIDEPIECYVGFKEEKYETAKRVSKDELLRLVNNNTK